MSFEDVRNTLVERLDEGDRGDRGWFIITRVHVALSWLKGIAEYLESRSLGGAVQLSGMDYQRLAQIIDSQTADPGVQLRRHHLLVMDKPLQLLRRPAEPSWSTVELTNFGRALAATDDPAAILESVLSEMRFAVVPWSSADRAERYGEFDLPVYEATKQVLAACDGYVDRDEFDLFVSRIREASEIDWATSAIELYRDLTEAEQGELRLEVRNRIPGAKAYSNWRDIGLHTFSLFSLGTSMVRDGTTLRLTGNWAKKQLKVVSPPAEGGAPQELKLPEPIASEDLMSPPAAPATNDGADAESFVAKVLRAEGWTVAFYTNRRGFGFDLWAKKGDSAIVVEVKSSVGQLGSVSLTETEYRASVEHGQNFVLALVEHLDSDNPKLTMVENPAEVLAMNEKTAKSYTIARAEWINAAEP